MDFGMKGWNELGVVGIIYEEDEEEEEDDDDDAKHSPLSPCSSINSLRSLSPAPQFSKEKPPWKHRPDVVIHVQGSCFRLHKQALTARSTYLKRHLSEFPEITLSPPLNITAPTFSLVTDFCYGTHVAVTPFNVAALRTAAELLGMTGAGGAEGENLQEVTEAYFRRVVAVNKECASIVLQSCFPLLPEAETAAGIVSRCVEALSLTAGDDGDEGCLDGFKNVGIDDLKLILEAVSRRLTTESHDFIYRIVDVYLKQNFVKTSDDTKIQLCNYIDCNTLSPQLLMHAVQNPRMPLRFVVQAMFLQQLYTRHSIISAADHHHHRGRSNEKIDPSATTLGAILQRDAALRQVSQLKAVMTATNSRIQSLEEELSGMRKLLNETETGQNMSNRIGSGRSASFRFSSEPGNRVERGQVGSVSSVSYRDIAGKGRGEVSSSSEGSSEGSPGVEKNIGRRLIDGLRSAFRLQKKKCENKGATKDGEILGGEEVVVIKKDQGFLHKRSRSQF